MPDRAEEPPHGLAHHRVVIHHQDNRLALGSPLAPHPCLSGAVAAKTIKAPAPQASTIVFQSYSREAPGTFGGGHGEVNRSPTVISGATRHWQRRNLPRN